MVRTILSPLTTLVGYMISIATTFILSTVAIIIGKVRPASLWIRRIMRAWGWIVLRSIGSTWRVEGAEHIDPTRSYVVVSNHISNLDPPLVCTVLPIRISFLAKKELFRVPVFGTALRAASVVETDRQAHAAAHRRINEQVKVVIERRISLMIFPEGTRSRDGNMRLFKKGAFRIAIDNGMPILPIVISGTDAAWRPGTRLVRGGPITVVIHQPIETAGLDVSKDLSALRDDAQSLIRNTLEAARS